MLDFIMNHVYAIIIFILVFSSIVFIHELGHFMAAKFFGVKVEEFGLGLPPRFLTLYQDRAGTVYSLNLLPIGGFVSLKGEKYSDMSAYEKDSLAGSRMYKQMLIVLAGIFMNFLIAGAIFSAFFYHGIKPMVIETQFKTTHQSQIFINFDEAVKIGLLKVNGLMLSPANTNSIAARSGIKDKDVLLAINGKEVTKPEEMINAVKYFSAPIRFTILRGEKKFNLSITPVEGKIGCYVGYNILNENKDLQFKYPLKEAARRGYLETYNQSRMIIETLGIITKDIVAPKTAYERQTALSSIQGPIGIGDQFTKFVELKMNWSFYILVAALLSVNLAIFNLLPLPALDGGRFFIMVLNSVVIFIFGKKAIDEKVETLIHVFGFGLLILLSIAVAYMDLFKIFHN